MYPWQENMLNQIMKSGGKPGEMMIMASGRNTGKSSLTAATIKRLMDNLNSQPVTDMVLSEGTVYGSRYCCVEPVGGNWPAMEEWCTDTLGAGHHSIWAEPKAPEPAQRWYANNRKFWFRKESDRTMFILRWSR